NVAARPAPLRPRRTATSGPAQQSAEPIAAATPPPAASRVLAVGDGMAFQCLQNRALIRRTPGRARRGELLQGVLEAPQVPGLAFHQLNLLPGLPLDRAAGGTVPDPERQQLLDLLQ